jgi:hypothetical protein
MPQTDMSAVELVAKLRDTRNDFYTVHTLEAYMLIAQRDRVILEAAADRLCRECTEGPRESCNLESGQCWEVAAILAPLNEGGKHG